MARWSGTRKQRDAARTKPMGATGSAPAGPATRDGYRVSQGHHTTGPLRREHVVINGHQVEVTEDDIGVTELHLE